MQLTGDVADFRLNWLCRGITNGSINSPAAVLQGCRLNLSAVCTISHSSCRAHNVFAAVGCILSDLCACYPSNPHIATLFLNLIISVGKIAQKLVVQHIVGSYFLLVLYCDCSAHVSACTVRINYTLLKLHPLYHCS